MIFGSRILQKHEFKVKQDGEIYEASSCKPKKHKYLISNCKLFLLFPIVNIKILPQILFAVQTILNYLQIRSF